MTVDAFIKKATQQLSDSGITTARLDCLVLLEDTFGQNRAHLLAHGDDTLTSKQIEQLELLITRRCAHEPLAYIRGHVMFYGRDFIVTPDVLVPRPETEIMIEVLKKLPLSPGAQLKIADIGTGSGCIGITTALELPQVQVDLYDISSEALAIATRNAEILGASINSVQADLLDDIDQPYDVLLANLPYVPDNFPINRAAGFEPKLALFAGVDGLRDYQTFWRQLSVIKAKPSYILSEAFPSQHHALATIARHAGYALEDTQDFIQLYAHMN